MAKPFDLESLLSDILDDSKPLPAAEPAPVQSPEKLESNHKVNAAGGPFAAMSKDPDDFLAGLGLPTPSIEEVAGVTQQCNDDPELATNPPAVEEEEGPVLQEIQLQTPQEVVVQTEMQAAMRRTQPPMPQPLHEQMNEPVSDVPIFTDSKPDAIRIKIPTFTTPDLAETMDIRNFATLVTLNTARWHAKVKDRQASRDAAAANQADAEAFETRKRLLVGADEKLKAIHKAIDEARSKHYELTLPWTTTGMDDVGRRVGGRLLPNTLFFEYTQEMARCKTKMQAALDAFVPDYPQLIAAAQKKLGKRFDPREYPNAESIAGHFDLSFDFQPIPKGNDFKGLPQQQLDALSRHLNNSTQKMAENAMQDVWVRLREAVERMADRLSSPDKLFHHTLVSNVRDVARLLVHLNITGDQRVEEIRKRVEKHLCPHEPKDLRENAVLRAQVGAHAVSILQEMDK